MDLDIHNDYQKIDQTGIRNLIEELPDQIELIWDQINKVVLPANYANINNIHLIYPPDEYIAHELIRPLVSVYDLPIYFNNISSDINEKSLVIASSFYGSDSRLVQLVNRASKLGTKLFILSAGGELSGLMSKYRCPGYIYRAGAMVEYTLAQPLISIFYILHKLKMIDYDNDIEELLLLTHGLLQKIKPDIPTDKNIAKQTAHLIANKLPVILGSNISRPVINRLTAMLSINSKQLAIGYDINEFSSGQVYKDILPEKIFNNLIFLIFNSKYNNPEDHVKLLATCQVLEKRRLRYESISIQPGGHILSELVQGVLLVDFIAYYLAILNDTDPADYAPKEQFDSMVDSNIGHKIRKNGVL